MGWLLKDDPNDKKKQDTRKDDEPGKPTFARSWAPAQGGYSPSAPVFAATPTQEADPAMVVEVEAALSAATPEAYRKFTAILQQLAPAVTNEAERFKAALAMAKLQGITPSDVGSAYEARLTGVAGIETKFASQQAQFAAKAKSEAEQRLTQLRTNLEQEQTKLAQAQAAIAAGQAELQVQEQRAQQAQEGIAEVGRKMATAISNVRTRITAERDQVARNLGGN